MLFKVKRIEKTVASIIVEADSIDAAIEIAESVDRKGDAFGHGEVVDAKWNVSATDADECWGRSIYTSEFVDN